MKFFKKPFLIGITIYLLLNVLTGSITSGEANLEYEKQELLKKEQYIDSLYYELKVCFYFSFFYFPNIGTSFCSITI